MAATANLGAEETFALDDAVARAVEEVVPEVKVVEQQVLGSPLSGGRQRLVLALTNILRNAGQARSSPAVQIWIASARDGEEVELVIDDDGPGIPEEHRERVFESGFSTRAGGTGLGLALVREVVQTELHGRVACLRSPHGGARFVLRLPIARRTT
jgi:signal transduction histidine kinase